MSLRRLWTVCRLDLAHAARRPLFWIWAVLVFFCAMGLASGGLTIQAGDSATGGIKAHVNSAFANALELTLLGGLFYTFFVAFAAGMEVIRDREARVEVLLNATPLRPGEYVWGKFLASLVACVAILGLQLATTAFFKQGVTAQSDPEIVGAFRPLAYLQPALLLSLPLIVFMAGVAFAIGERWRRPVLVNMFPLALLLVCVFVLWLWTPAWLDERWNRALMLIDPTGFRWLQQTWLEVDRGAGFYNTHLLGFDAGFFATRAAMVAIGLGAVLSAQLHLARAMRGERVPARVATEALSAAPAAFEPARERRPLAELSMRQARPAFLAAALEIGRVELKLLFTSAGVWLFLPLLIMNATFDAIYSVGAFDTRLLLTPGRSAVGSLDELTFTLCLLLMFFTVESLRREEGSRLAPMAFSCPISNRALMLGKLLATSALGALCMLAVFLVCAVLLLIQGTVPLDVGPYLLVYGLLMIPVVFFWNALVAAVYALTRNRFATYALGLGLMIWTAITYALGDLSWTWNWSLLGALRWTDLGPFEIDRSALLLNRLMTVLAGATLLALTARVFPRRAFDATRVVLRLRPAALARTGLRLLPWAIVPIALGIALQRGINAGPDGARAERWGKDYWRKNVRTWLDAPEPEIVDADVALELDPAARHLKSSGTFVLRNPHAEPLAQIALTGAPHWRDLTWTLDGAEVEPDDRSGLFVFTPAVPLARGERCTLGFAFEGTLLEGFTKNGGGAAEFILPSGVVLTSFSPTFVPLVGFQEGVGVDEDNRYDSREYPDDFYAGTTHAAFGPDIPHPVRVRVTAPAEYTINGVGVKTEDVLEGDLRTVTWESDHPIRFFNVVGGRWDVRRGEGTAIYYYPPHTYNLDEMIAALDGARRYYSEWFYPFPWDELRVSEFAAHAGYAQGFPTNITFSEALGFLSKDEESFSAAFFVTAHESAHQWWGNLLMPGKGPGGNLLSEGTSHFSTILLIDAVKGPEARIEFCKLIESRYGENCVVDSERPLVKIDGSKDGDTTVTYDKMGFVTWMLLQHLGRERMLEGLQAFFARYVDSEDHPVLQDFTRHLRDYAPDPDAYDAFVEQWFHAVVIPEYKLEDVRVETSEAGERTVRARLVNAGTGRMPVEVAASRGERFPKDDDDADGAEPYREARAKAVLGPGEEAELSIPCDFEPELLVVDPDALVLQLNRKRALHRF